MKMHFKGIIKSTKDLPQNELPENAVKFKEPNNALLLNLAVIPFCVAVLVVMFVVLAFLCSVKGCDMPNAADLRGLLLFFIFMIPHEIVHALAHPKEAEVNIYILPSALAACVWSACPLSKGRFIFMSIMPFLVFTVLPMIVWAFLPVGTVVGDILIAFAFYHSLGCSGDMLNIFNGLVQMPEGSKEILSGMNSYWYTEE